MLKEIIFFTSGDSADASLWSNVPYLFAKTLESKGIKIHRVNIQSSRWIYTLFDKTIFRFLGLFFRNSSYNFSRSRLEKYLSYKRIKRAVCKYPYSDYCFFLMFGYYNKFSSIPSLLFGDWTFEHLIINRRKRNPNCLERLMINQENEAISNAAVVIPMFYDAQQTILKSNPQSKTAYRKLNVVNVLNDDICVSDNLVNVKIKSNIILFIGRKSYIEGANLLLKSFSLLCEKYHHLELHIIGMNATDFNDLPSNVYCHGFLHKDSIKENAIYYDLVSKAKLIINPTKKWAGYSSMIEAMYFYTPVVVTPYFDFVNDFGEEINFGRYCEDFTESGLMSLIESVLFADNYKEMALAAHDAVKNCTWENYIDWIENVISSQDNAKVK